MSNECVDGIRKKIVCYILNYKHQLVSCCRLKHCLQLDQLINKSPAWTAIVAARHRLTSQFLVVLRRRGTGDICATFIFIIIGENTAGELHQQHDANFSDHFVRLVNAAL